ncbi:hypothetical protein DAEQUDRAFT_733652 [Daedalea quercina L-15889]|uniref:F-box domain-containing protein n=1 Tax=Daedalea quercina L-15889 TaxID=1314783 RepID=A0A165KUJ9_9APHY|nr:hypothetical protein DAEQUDRAFT_733652 [Daedalea quercina L-15889]
MLPVLPVEIWERVIDHLWEWPLWLSRCALVCRVWHVRSHFHLVSRTTLSNSQQTHRFAKLLKSHPELRRQVEWVLICDATFVRDGVSSMDERRPMAHIGAFAAMLAKALPADPAMRFLKIADAEWKPGMMHRNTLIHLSAFAGISGLSLYHVTFPSKAILSRLICALPNLVLLECASVVCQNKASNPSLYCAASPRVKKLMLDGPSDDVADLIGLQPGIVGGLEMLWAGWSRILLGECPSSSAIAVILQHAGSALKCVDIRLQQLPGTTVDGEHTEGALTAANHPLRALRHCTELEVFCLAYCLPTTAGSITISSPQSPNWLYDTLANITSAKLHGLHLNIDVRHIEDVGTSCLIDLVHGFLDELQCTQIDKMLAREARFKRLKRFGIYLLCGPQTPAPDEESWRAAVFAKFPELCARRMLSGEVLVRMD